MAEYRDIEKLRKQIADCVKVAGAFADSNSEFLNGYISALDAVGKVIDESSRMEVVRCKDCEYRKTEDCAMQYECDCGAQYFWESDNAFCSLGKRKENE